MHVWAEGAQAVMQGPKEKRGGIFFYRTQMQKGHTRSILQKGTAWCGLEKVQGWGRWCLQRPPTSEGEASWGAQLPSSEQLVPSSPLSHRALCLLPQALHLCMELGGLQTVYCKHTSGLETSWAGLPGSGKGC